MKTVLEKVEAARAKYPDLTVPNVCKKVGVSMGTYYSQKAVAAKKAAKPAKKGAPAYKRLVTREPKAEPARRQVAVIIGTPDEVREVLAGRLA